MGCVWSKERPLTKEEIAELYQRNFQQSPLIDDQTLGDDQENKQSEVECSLKGSSGNQKNDLDIFTSSSNQQINQPMIQNSKIEEKQQKALTDVRKSQSQQVKVQHQQKPFGEEQGLSQIRQNIGIIQPNIQINTNMTNQLQAQGQNRVQQQKLFNLEQEQHQLIIMYFEIQQSQKSMKQTPIPSMKQSGYLQISEVNQLLTQFLMDQSKLNPKMKVQWLLEVYNKIINDIQAFQNSYNQINNIQPDICQSLLIIIGQHLTALLLNAQIYQIHQMKERRHVHEDRTNQIANIIYELVFQQTFPNNNKDVLHAYNDNDRTIILDWMLKRELTSCSKITLMNNSAQLKSLQLLETIAEYPFLIEPLLLDSWGFVIRDIMKTGRNIQDHTIIGRALSLSSFPNETTETPNIFSNMNKNRIESELDVFRVRINLIIDSLARLFRKLLLLIQKTNIKIDFSINYSKYNLNFNLQYDIQLLDELTVKYTMRFLYFSSTIALNQILDGQPGQQYGMLPNMFLTCIHSFIRQYFSNNQLRSLFYEEVMTMSELICRMMHNKDLIQNVQIRVLGIKIFYYLALLKQLYKGTGLKIKLLNIFVENTVIVNTLLEGLINIYVESEKLITNDQASWGFMFCEIVNYLFTFHPKIYIPKLNEIGIKQNRITIQFARIYVSEITKFFSQSVESMKKLKELETLRFQHNENQKQEEQYQVRQLSSFTNNLVECYKNIVIFNEYLSEAFSTEEIRGQFACHLNEVLMKLNGPSSNIYKTNKLDEVKFNSKMFTTRVIEVIIVQSKSQQFLEEIVKDGRSFSIELFKKTKDILYRENSLPLYNILEFDKIILKLMKLSNINTHYETIEQEAPEEFIDPMLGKLMTDPIQLPNSKVILDRVTIQKQLLINEIDPYDRTRLTEDMLIELPQLRQRITQFIQNKMNKIQQNHDIELQLEIKVGQLDNIPANFKDSLNQRLMLDPYILPSSGVISLLNRKIQTKVQWMNFSVILYLYWIQQIILHQEKI